MIVNTIYYSKKEELEIIKKYQELIIYVYNLTKKYPRDDNNSLSGEIKDIMFKGLENLVFTKKTYNKNDKIKYLLKVSSNLNILLILMRISIKYKYITKRNYTAWSYKVVEIDNMLEKWINSCQRH